MPNAIESYNNRLTPAELRAHLRANINEPSQIISILNGKLNFAQEDLKKIQEQPTDGFTFGFTKEECLVSYEVEVERLEMCIAWVIAKSREDKS